jgi:hypothetical protein
MLRFYFWLIFTVMICAIRSSNASNCTQLSLSQVISTSLLTGSNTKLADYAQSLQDLITAGYKDLFNETLGSINYTATSSGTSNTVSFNLLVACSVTTTTTSAGGKTTTTEVASQVNKTRVQDVISTGLFSKIFTNFEIYFG